MYEFLCIFLFPHFSIMESLYVPIEINSHFPITLSLSCLILFLYLQLSLLIYHLAVYFKLKQWCPSIFVFHMVTKCILHLLQLHSWHIFILIYNIQTQYWCYQLIYCLSIIISEVPPILFFLLFLLSLIEFFLTLKHFICEWCVCF
jgi:hypothetical protein